MRGPDALTTRRLGASLGVEAMAIYHHFAGRDELLVAIGDRLLEPLHDLDLGDDWREACRRFAPARRDLAVAMPSTFRLLGLSPFDTPVWLRPVERFLGVLVDHSGRTGHGAGRPLSERRVRARAAGDARRTRRSTCRQAPLGRL